MNPLGPTQYELLAQLASSPEARVRRIQGGFWTTEDGDDAQEVAWKQSLRFVRDMEARGFIERTNSDPRETHDPRRITAAGIAAIAHDPQCDNKSRQGSIAGT